MTYETECAGKVRHLTRRDARRVARRYPGERLNPYCCGHCGFWHLGHFNEFVREHARNRKEAQ